MQWIFYAFLLFTIASKLPIKDYAPLTVDAFEKLVIAVKNETMETLGFHYEAFYNFLQLERSKFSQSGQK